MQIPVDRDDKGLIGVFVNSLKLITYLILQNPDYYWNI